MMKTLKVGLLGLALGMAGALVLPSTEAAAQGSVTGHVGGGTPAGQVCCSICNPRYAACLSGAGGNTSQINQCASTRASCESNCARTC